MACYNEFARFYDRFITPVDYRARAKYFDMLIKRYIGEQQNLLLDLACGTASLSLVHTGDFTIAFPFYDSFGTVGYGK